jgi:hypothetical protein
MFCGMDKRRLRSRRLKVQRIQNAPQFRDEQLRQGASLGRFDFPGMDAFCLRYTMQTIQQNGFAEYRT